MSLVKIIFTVLALFVCAAPAAALADTTISDEALQPLAAWVGQATGVEMIVLPTAVVSDRKLEKMLHIEDAQHAGAAGAYLPGRIAISSQVWDPTSLTAQSYLVHELVHHAQFLSGHDYPCHAAKEREAYTLQNRWLTEHGLKPVTSQAWIDSMSRCADVTKNQ